MDYLKGNATASAGAIYVICRHLARAGGPITGVELRRAVRPLPEHQGDDDQGKASDSLATSLKVAVGIGAIVEDSNSAWSVEPAIAEGIAAAGSDAAAWFRAELLRRINAEAMASLAAKEKPADLVLGMAWFLQQDPLKPLGAVFGNGAEATLGQLAMADGTAVKAVENAEQWRSFQRWILALGLARSVDVPGAKVVVADASTAIADSLAYLPTSERAGEWLAALRKRLPIFGASTLLAALPAPRTGWHDIPPAVSLGLLKLEKRDVLALESADDGRGVVTVGLGGGSRQVGIIKVTGVAA
ncbi:hypothetical protein ABIE44_002732 [Marmoricola sp. OAE513]|uniref:hypothetical protein n=1 Tax=Marmoricola sp. OAE513 TaxID=2817894 RepID=UPI001AE23BF4